MTEGYSFVLDLAALSGRRRRRAYLRAANRHSFVLDLAVLSELPGAPAMIFGDSPDGSGARSRSRSRSVGG